MNTAAPARLTRSLWEADRSVDLVDTTAGQVLRDAAADAPDAVALVDGTGAHAPRRSWTYAEFLDVAENVAGVLSSRFRPGERVAVWAPNMPEWEMVQFGRAEEFAELGRRRPPTLVMHGQHIPPISEWPLRATSSAGDLATPGTVLEGIGASPGIAEGTARVVDDLSEVDDLEPGEILVCAVTDPSWTPLLMVSEAVVCQVGAEGSHAAVISRELGTPCVMSVRNVLNRLKDGQRIRVDGTKGTVTVLE